MQHKHVGATYKSQYEKLREMGLDEEQAATIATDRRTPDPWDEYLRHEDNTHEQLVERARELGIIDRN